MDKVFDVAVIGGGINGCGCAADAAQRGLSVVLLEQDDLASRTSSKSSKLIHGGLRYLEYYDFGLVKKALNERETLMTLAPHLVKPLPFVLPHQKNSRALWLLRLGLFIYDHLSRHYQLPNSRFIKRLSDEPYFRPLVSTLTQGFCFYDCTADDARLTVTNALQAKEHGATILTRTKLTSSALNDKIWQLEAQTTTGTISLQAKTIINATGPWVNHVNALLDIPITQALSFVKGSHLVIKKLYEGDHAYMLQTTDKRIVFTIPYYNYTLVGTTDILLKNEFVPVEIETTEMDYLTHLIQRYFNIEIKPSDIISTWSGVRTLLSHEETRPSMLSRDYSYQYTQNPATAISIYGGKITTYRQLAQKVVNLLQNEFSNLPPSITQHSPLPGAILDGMTYQQYQAHVIKNYTWIEKTLLQRYLACYGTRTEILLDQCKQKEDLGQHFFSDLYQCEVDYLITHEWAQTTDDILWRRTKLGLAQHASGETLLTDYLQNNLNQSYLGTLPTLL